MFNTYELILKDQEMQSLNWDPWTPLGLDMPSFNLYDGFNTPDVKKKYRKMAVQYHPDKVAKLPEDQQESAKKKWTDVVKAMECLTDKKKFENWV